MTHSTRGAARVSIMWMISVGVVCILSLVFAFLLDGDKKVAEDARAVAETERDVAQDAEIAATDKRRLVSNAIGWTNGALDADTNLVAAADGKELLRSVFSDLDTSHATFEDMIPVIISQFNSSNQAVVNANSETTSAKSAMSAAQSSLAQVSSDKDGVIRGLQSDKADAQSGFDTREGDLSRQLSAAQDRVRELETANNSLQAEKRKEVRDLNAIINTKDTQLAALSEQTRPFRSPANLTPDGQILEVSESLPLAWIDLGSENRLVLGTRFRVEAGNLGERTLKAWAEVIEVNDDIAKVRLTDLVDKFNPVVSGDYLVNPVYEPNGDFNAVLVGRFSGLYGKSELAILLEKIGIHVQDGLDPSTNFLIAGAPVMQDEDGYPLMEPLEASALPEYQQAEANHVQIITLASIQEFFVF